MKRIITTVLISVLVFYGCTSLHREEVIKSSQDSFGNSAFVLNKECGQSDFRRAVWISYLDLTEIINCNSEKELAERLDEVAEELVSINTTDVFVQVIAFGDALHYSDFLPSANGITYNIELIDNIDVFREIVETFQDIGIRVSAWINPYRLANDELQIEKFCSKALSNGVSAVIPYNGHFYLDPSDDNTINLITDCVRELIEKYAVDGIHFDDYYYPTTSEDFDGIQYDLYIANGGGMSLEDWRRDNVKKLIKSVYDTVKSISDECEFSVSPDSSIDRDRNIHYLDVEAICTQKGYIDYVCPQIYYGYDNETMDYIKVLNLWSKICTKVDFMVGLAFYKVGVEDKYAGSGLDEWIRENDIIGNQYIDAQNIENCIGIALFRYNSLFKPSDDVSAAVSSQLANYRKVL